MTIAQRRQLIRDRAKAKGAILPFPKSDKPRQPREPYPRPERGYYHLGAKTKFRRYLCLEKPQPWEGKKPIVRLARTAKTSPFTRIAEQLPKKFPKVDWDSGHEYRVTR